MFLSFFPSLPLLLKIKKKVKSLKNLIGSLFFKVMRKGNYLEAIMRGKEIREEKKSSFERSARDCVSLGDRVVTIE